MPVTGLYVSAVLILLVALPITNYLVVRVRKSIRT